MCDKTTPCIRAPSIYCMGFLSRRPDDAEPVRFAHWIQHHEFMVNFIMACKLRCLDHFLGRSDAMKSARALSAAIGSCAVNDYVNSASRLRPRPGSGLYRMNLASRRPTLQVLAGFARGVIAADMAPGLVVKSRAGEVLSVLQRTTNANALRRFAERKLLPRFDFTQMTRLAVGDVWFRASRRQQRALENGFREMLVSNCIASLNAAASSDLQIEVQPVRHSDANDVTVKTLITRAGMPTLAIDFRMEIQRKDWKVYDLLVTGVSLLSIYRETFVEVVRRSGIDGLVRFFNANPRTFVPRNDFHSGSST